MKLVIQIPCYNEQDCILEVLKSIPKEVKGIDEIEVFVIDDGSYDDTASIAQKFGVNVIKLPYRIGLANVFKIGVNHALEQNADILINLDGDNQYCANDIEKLIAPILQAKADMTIGVRPIDSIKTFSKSKKFFQKLGSLIVKLLSGVDVKDAASGFRAFNKNALLKLNVFNNFTYTIETIVQSKYKNLVIENVDINVNIQKSRKSRLFKNDFDYILKQACNLIRFFIIYRPCRFFGLFALMLFFIGFALGCRFLYFYMIHDGSGHVQSLILCAIVLILSFVCFMLAIIGDLFSVNRKILDEIRYEIRLNKYKK
ncbi:glycosyltransferase family 2 protein [bacterium]|nr:glycosyltransferase family 2 protein [bacterium]